MNSKKFTEAMSEIDNKYVDEAIGYKKKVKRPAWVKWGAMAACLCLIIAGAVVIPHFTETTPDGLPMLDLSDVTGTGMGFEGELCYDITEMYNGNPWTAEMELPFLPVYKNGSYHAAGVPTGLKEEVMMERLENTAKALGIEAENIETEKEGLTTTRVTGEADNLKIEVSADGVITVWFDEGLALPEAYNFTYYDTTDEEAEQVLDYLMEQYSALIDFTQPEKVLSGFYVMWNDYDEAGNYISMPKYEREYLLYDAAGGDVEDILNYTYNYIQFAPDDNGNLMLIRLYDSLSCAEKLGDYPTITADEARSMLLNGNYLTSVPYEITDEELIQRVELVYRNSRTEKIFMPYYRFYVEIPEMKHDNGLTDYGAYYVPAIKSEYISNMPMWDGSLN
jgi:hypothetical protein